MIQVLLNKIGGWTYVTPFSNEATSDQWGKKKTQIQKSVMWKLCLCNWLIEKIYVAWYLREGLSGIDGLCVAGAAVSSRGGRGKLSRDTNENERRERNPALFFSPFSFLSLSVSSPLHITLSFSSPSVSLWPSSSAVGGPVVCLGSARLAGPPGCRICLLSWSTGFYWSGLARQTDRQSNMCLLFTSEL